MSSWIALHNNEMTKVLLERYPNAFLLLTQIGLRAWWKKDEKSPVGLEYGQAFIGDYRSIGLTEKGYRVAKRRLAKGGLVSFVGANKGTVATLIDSRVYSLSKQLEGEPRADKGTGKGRAKGEERATNSHTQLQSQLHVKKEESHPLPFESPKFAESWTEWIQYLKEKRKTPTERTIKAQLKKLSTLNQTDAITTITTAIESGWQSLHPRSSDNRAGGANGSGRANSSRAPGAAGKGITVPIFTLDRDAK